MDTDITITSIVVGSLLPNLIAIIVQPRWRSETRGLVTFAVCVIAGLLIALVQGQIGSGQNVATSIVAVLLTSQILYGQLYHPSGITDRIEAATSATTFRPPSTR